jgi:hypothetical protein
MGFPFTQRGGDALVSQTNVSEDMNGQGHSPINRNLCPENICKVTDLISLDGAIGNQHLNGLCSFGSMMTGPTPTVITSLSVPLLFSVAFSIIHENWTFIAANNVLLLDTEKGTSNA